MLLDDARSCRESLIRAEAARNGIEEARALAAKRKELQKFEESIAILIRCNTLLREQGVPLTSVTDVDKAKQRIDRIHARFVESPKVSTLVDGKRWINLISTLSEFVQLLENQQKQDWKVYFNSTLFGGVSPDQRKQTILQALPENQKAIEQYKYYYQRLNQYRNSVPSSAEALREAHECSKELENIQFVENDEVPVPVRAFFNATSSAGGASLDFLTPEVIEWLRANNMLANYVIRAR
jgi:hypothetical protein